MIGIVGIIAYLTVLSLSLVITRIATIALMLHNRPVATSRTFSDTIGLYEHRFYHR